MSQLSEYERAWLRRALKQAGKTPQQAERHIDTTERLVALFPERAEAIVQTQEGRALLYGVPVRNEDGTI